VTVTKVEPVRITGKPNSKEKRSVPFKDTMRRHLTLKELQEKKYSFLARNVGWGSFNFQSQEGPRGGGKDCLPQMLSLP